MSGRVQTFEIPGRLEGVNEITKADRAGYHVGARLRKRSVAFVHMTVSALRPRLKPCEHFPVAVKILCIEPNNLRDIDNIAGGAFKVILDGLVAAGVLPDDGPEYVNDIGARRDCDPENPRIVVTITEPN